MRSLGLQVAQLGDRLGESEHMDDFRKQTSAGSSCIFAYAQGALDARSIYDMYDCDHII